MSPEQISEALDRLGAKHGVIQQVVKCPVHPDKHPSLSLTTKDGNLLYKCHRGCTQDSITDWIKSGQSQVPYFSPSRIVTSKSPIHQPLKGKDIEATYDYLDASGSLLYRVVRLKTDPGEAKKFVQEHPDGRGGWLSGRNEIPLVLYKLPELLAEVAQGKTIYFVEGEKDVLSLRTINLPATSCAGGAAAKWLQGYSDAFIGADVVIFPDNDEPGGKHALKVLKGLQGVAKSVKIVELPGLPEKGDVSDWLESGGTARQLMELVFDVSQVAGLADSAVVQSKPQIQLQNRQLDDLTEDVLSKINQANNPPDIFVKSGNLCRIHRDEADRICIRTHNIDSLRDYITRKFDWVKVTVVRENEKTLNVRPDKELIANILVQEDTHFPPIESVVTAPVVGIDGQFSTNIGYHPSSRTYLNLSQGVMIGDTTPTPTNVKNALAIIDELLHDFPFADDASKAHAISFMLLPFVRPLISGPTPIHLFNAPNAGTGKTLLAKICALPAVGTLNLLAAPKDEEAMGKLITTYLMTGSTHFVFDNVSDLNSDKLLSAVTSVSYSDRLMGGNTAVNLEVKSVWGITSNNIKMSDELVRRCISIRLDSNSEAPASRAEFIHPDIEEWANEHRGELITALLIIVNTWLNKGRPAYSGHNPPLGSFECWHRVMGGILEAVGIPGFLDNLTALKNRADTDNDAWKSLVEEWYELYEVSAISGRKLFPLAERLLPDKCGSGDERARAIAWGKAISKQVDRVYGGWKIINSGRGTTGEDKKLKLYCLSKPITRENTILDFDIPLESEIKYGSTGNMGNVIP